MQHIEHPVAYENAIKRNILNNARKTFHAQNADGYEIVAFLADNQWSEFAQSLFSGYENFGKLSPAQCNAARNMMAKSAARKAEKESQKAATVALKAATSGHVGTVGKREDFTFKIGKIIELFGTYGVSYLMLCEDANGNAIVYKGTSSIGEEGETVTVKATVKEHSAYNGIAQTILSRPKVL